jgi:glutamate-1-semialdehyde 2,1-aminomutase
MLREWTVQNEALLILDEVITFRSRYGGAQEWYNLEADITAMGKIIGGGFPVGALAGKNDIMDVMNPLESNLRFPHSGTFSANPVTMTAGLAAMQLFDRPAVERLNELSARARSGIEEVIRRTGARACVTGGGSMLRLHMKPKLPNNYREAFSTPEEKWRLSFMLDHLSDSGFITINTCAFTMSTAMGESEIDSLVDAVEIGFRRLAADR